MIEHLRGRDRKLEPLGWTVQDAECRATRRIVNSARGEPRHRVRCVPPFFVITTRLFRRCEGLRYFSDLPWTLQAN